MFGKKKSESIWTFTFGGRAVRTDQEGYDILRDMYHEMGKLKLENKCLKEELETIKPIVENKDIKPPVSRDCGDCKFAVYNPWDNISVIGCRKDCLCGDFTPKEGNR